jgi:F0F1-type ATP synthase assembly protein I
MSDSGPDPERLRDLAAKLDEVHRQSSPRNNQPSSNAAANIVLRLSVELVAAPLLGGAMGLGLDWVFGYFGIHTKPVFTIVMFLLGCIAGVRNVIRAAQDINAQSQGGATKDGE